VAVGLGVVEDFTHARKQCAREPGHLQGVCVSRPVREGERTIIQTYVLEGSDCAILPMKLPNKEGEVSAEAAEGRAQTKENDAQLNTSRHRAEHPCPRD
jgi:hypothetical protein